MVELTNDDLSMFSNFERVTHVMPSDYLITETSLIFLVSQDTLGKAIGKHAANIEKLKMVFRKRVIIVADSSDQIGRAHV
jgi:transcription antitermination factor NusA-like protein